MRCPHCHIHYLDEERVCPICGKRAGVAAQRTQTKSVRRVKSVKADTSPAKKANTPSKPKPSSGWTTKPSKSARKTRKNGKKRGCITPLFLIILLYILISFLFYRGWKVVDVIASHVPFSDTMPWEEEDWGTDEDVVWYDYPVECMVGTWENQTNGDRLTVQEDGSVTVLSNGSAYVSSMDDSFFCVLDVDDSNAKEYLSEKNRDLIDDYPPEDYYYCELDCYPRDEEDDIISEQCLSLLIYLPRNLYDSGEPAEPGTELEVYHHVDYDSEGNYDPNGAYECYLMLEEPTPVGSAKQ